MTEKRLPSRIPPHSEEAERALLGALLLDHERVADVADWIQAEDFFGGRNGLVYEGILSLAQRNAPIDFITLSEALLADGKLEAAGGRDYLVELAGSATSAAHVPHHARIVAETASLRRLIRESSEITALAYETRPDGDAVQELLDASEHRVFSIASSRDKGGAEPLSTALRETFQRLDAHRGGLTGLTTGYYDLDDLLCGLNGGDLVVLAARPSVGKTALALNLSVHAAMSRPEWLSRQPSVLIFSLEMGRQQIASRMLCMRARVDAHLLRSGRLPADERQELLAAADELSRARIFIDDSPGLSVMSLRSRARRLKARRDVGLDLIVVDYLQLLSFPQTENRLQEISHISRALKAVARELEVPVVALAQLSRAVENRDPPRPQLADLRESGSIEQDADVVLLLYRPERHLRQKPDEAEGGENIKGLVEVICAKQRNGPTGTVRLQFFDNTMRFENRAPQEAEPMSRAF